MDSPNAAYAMTGIRVDHPALADQALPRPLYILQIPGILVLVGLMTFAVGTEPAMAVAAGTATATALFMLWDWLLRLGPTRISTTFAINLLLGYGGGTLNTYFTLARTGSLAAVYGTSEPVLARGMASVLFVAAFLCFVGELYEKPILPADIRIPLNQKTYLFVYLGTAALLAGFATHVIGFAGVAQTGAGEQQNPIAAVLSACLTPIVTISISSCVAAPKGSVKWSLILCAVTDAILQMTVDRRSVFYMTLLTLFVLRTSGYRLRGNAFRNILLFGGLGAFAFFGITMVMLLRLAGFQEKSYLTSLPRRVEIVSAWIAEGSAFDRASEANASNLKRRSFVVAFYSTLVDESADKTPALGASTLSQVVLSIPRVLFPGKDAPTHFGVVMMGEEAFSNALFGTSYRDEANSILTAGAIDFGVVGIFVFPLLTAFTIRKLIAVASRYLNILSYIFLVTAAVQLSLPTEVGLFAYFGGIRNLIIIGTLLYLFQRLPRLGWSANSH